MTPATKYPTASQNPPRISQIRFNRVRMAFLLGDDPSIQAGSRSEPMPFHPGASLNRPRDLGRTRDLPSSEAPNRAAGGS